MCQRSCYNRTRVEIIKVIFIIFGEIESYFDFTKRKVHDFTVQQRSFSEIRSWLYSE